MLIGKLKALFFVATLKHSKERSHTHLLSEFLAKHLTNFQTDSEVIRLIEYNIDPGVFTTVNADDWPMIFKKIIASDIVIFATPVWWGIQSSLM
ncbi:MAG: NAD(P)H-dependent oxidoreductase, partial [Thermoproteota archaeon]|nr:NAD(P)H-dependent oxidoreductase [Thermoproteota archaeon]